MRTRDFIVGTVAIVFWWPELDGLHCQSSITEPKAGGAGAPKPVLRTNRRKCFFRCRASRK
jgi:hypothetical protein